MKKKWLMAIIIIIIVIAFMASLRIIINKNKTKSTVDDFGSIKELVEYDGHKYIKVVKSSEEGYKKDIFIQFSKKPLNEDGATNQNLYEILIRHMAEKLKGINFRIIDEEKQLIIRITFEENAIKTYTINGDTRYWKDIKANYQNKNYEKETIYDFNIQAKELINAINNDWVYDSLEIENNYETINNYKVYKNGYKIRTVANKIYNIVYTTDYKNPIVDGITVGMTTDIIQEKIGNSKLQTDVIIGYKTKDMYIFFENDEISIYPLTKYDEASGIKFGKAVEELNTTGDMNTFLNKLTDIYPDYTSFERTKKTVNIKYPLRGFEVKMGYDKENGITIYQNYQGKITETTSIEDLINNNLAIQNVYTKLDKNLVLLEEVERKEQGKYLQSGVQNE